MVIDVDSEREAESRAPAWVTSVVRWLYVNTEQRTWVRYVGGITLLVAVVALAFAVIVYTENADLDETGGAVVSYIGLAVVSVVSCAFPVPGLAPVLYGLIMYQGSALYAPLVAIVAGLSMALGQCSAYLLGAVGVGVAHRRAATRGVPKQGGWRERFDRFNGSIEGWMQKRGFITLVILASIPNPVILFANMSAGATGMPFLKFYTAMAIGMTIRAAIFAGIGMWIGAAT